MKGYFATSNKIFPVKFAILFLFTFVTTFVLHAQQLTVEKIMRDPKWIGTQPSNLYWGTDSKTIYFSWNPAGNVSDSTYSYHINTRQISPVSYKESVLLSAIKNGKYNHNNTQLLYVLKGDLYWLDLETNSTKRITQTNDTESSPAFIAGDLISYTKNQDLYTWNSKTGLTTQVTSFSRNTPVAAPPVVITGRGNTARTSANSTTVSHNPQEQWLQQNQLQTSAVLKERKTKRDERDSFLKYQRDTDTLRIINIGDKTVQQLMLSPDGRFVSYRLYTAPVPSKNIIVPNFITESGFTTDINGRTKVGNTFGKTEFYIYDRFKDTIFSVSVDTLPGIKDEPGYLKDYPAKKDSGKKLPRPVMVYGPYWNQNGNKAFVDIRSQDNKDRWIMQLEPASGSFKLIDRQRDEAWIAGPGIGDEGFGAALGWINNESIYFQSEATGYSHLYTYQTTTAIKTQLTKGDYEVQRLVLSKNKKYFYLLTNEEHPGKQNWYRINIDGSNKEKITAMTGGYEIEMSPDEKFIACRYSYSNKPWELYIQENLPGKKPLQVTDKSRSPEFNAYAWREPKMVTIPAIDGATIYGRLYEPEAGKKNGAAIVFVHGAGYLQNVHYWWSSYFREYMFNNLLTDKGYTVIDIDYRASSGYGRNWRTGIYRFMGGKDLDDHVDAIDYLVKNNGIDKSRVGMYGGSYGGFITLMSLFTKPDVVKAGAALRPVTDWAHYNHGYTSNILNEPFNDSLAYARSSPIYHAAGLKNHLLICHGMVDVNVNFQDAVMLTQRLIELGKENWQIAPYPVEDHGFIEPSSWTDEYKRILKLFDDTLLK
jgi:acetyl esterase/lipase/uncharacterized membrane protein